MGASPPHILRRSPGIKDRVRSSIACIARGRHLHRQRHEHPSLDHMQSIYIETTPTAYEVLRTPYKKDYLRDDQKRLPSILINLFDQGQPSVFFHTRTAKLTGRGNPQILVILHSTRSSEW